MTDKDIKISISDTAFPTHFVSDKEKESKEFGLKIGEAIQYEWFRKDSGKAKFYAQWADFHKIRMYARAEQPIGKYKNELAIDGDLSWLNLDWTPIAIMPKFVDIVVNGMMERDIKAKAYAQDAISQTKRMKFQDTIEGQMAAKDILNTIQENTGINPFLTSPDKLPNSDEELSLYMQLNYKPAIEIAEEEAINTLLDENEHQDIKRRYIYDLVTIGIGAVKHDFLPGAGVSIEYVDPANLIYSYTEDPFFKDNFYFGEVKTIPVNELLKVDPKLTNKDLQEISSYSQAWYNYFNVGQYYQNTSFLNDTCTLLYFNYKTTKTLVYKKKKNKETNTFKMIPKEDTFNPPQDMMNENNFEKVDRTIDVWYSGIMVMGTNRLLRWELMSNMVRPKSTSQHAISNYIVAAPRIYKGSIESLGKRMIPFVDQIQINHLKLQQVSSRIVPDGVFLDADGVNEVDLGNGQAYNPEDALRMYFQTGSVIGRTYTQDGDLNHAKIPIQELNTQAGANKIQMLIMSYNHQLNMLRDATGINEARDASTPDPRSLVGIQKLAALNSNTATRHVLDSSSYIFRRLAQAMTYRVSDILQFADFKDDFASRIGKYNVAILDEIKELYIYDFGIFIEIAPDEEERATLEKNIDTALSKGDINLEDAIDIREVKNLKLANQLLKLKRAKKLEREERMEMQKQAMAAQQNLKAQEMASQLALQKIQLESQTKLSIKDAETKGSIAVLREEANLKYMLMQREFEFNMQLKGIESQQLAGRDKMKEDEKNKRITMQSSQQSKLIEQRQNNLPPIDFESNEDTLDGLDLGQFEPK